MAPPGTSLMGNKKAMKLRLLALSATAAIALAACNSSNQDAVNNAELNQPAVELNDLSTDAANDAANAEAAALGAQQNQLESENATAPDNTTNPSDDQEQNVSGM
jgi:uncharacterized protein YdgA (DUF945 family)